MDEKRHFLVPKHSIITEEHVSEILKKLHAKKEDLPTILKTDPMAKQLKAKIGDIIEVERDSPIAGKTICYRIVR